MNYLLKIAVFTVVVLTLSWIIISPIFDNEFSIYYLITLAYFSLATFMFHTILLKYLRTPQRFVAAYMAGTGVKFLITLGIIIVYFFYTKFRNDKMDLFLVILLVCYHLLFLVFETVVLFGISRSNKQSIT